MKVLVTGGAGFIGSHCCIALIEAGHDVVCIDNYANASGDVRDSIRAITGSDVRFHEHDVLDEEYVHGVIRDEGVDACIHLAGLKSISESIRHPEEYYRNNVFGMLSVVSAMKRAGVFRLIFSSSAVVYGAEGAPFSEDAAVAMPDSPYGKTKYVIEHLLEDCARADARWSVCLLRYFNPVGAHPSGLIGESPKDTPNNLMPLLLQAAAGESVLDVYGDDYPTRDGSCMRDYIHIQDLAEGHVAALAAGEARSGAALYNLGRGQGVTVLELIHAFQDVNGVEVPYRIVGRRPGDVAVNFATVDKARRELGWEATRGVEDMVRDAWRWKRRSLRK